MCLNTTNDTPLIADKDIKAYKICYVVVSSDNKMIKKNDIFALYHENFKYDLGKEYFEEDFEKQISPLTGKLKALSVIKLYDKKYIDAGFDVNAGFHCFKTFEACREHLSIIPQYYNVKNTERVPSIFECVIPKGTRYFEGTALSNEGYCSEKMILVKEHESHYDIF